MFEVEVLSKESIKPCIPTPQHLRTYKLSMIDRRTPCYHIPVIFFYTRTGEPISLLRSLKDSLSKTLTRYFPLAGRLVEGNSLVDCSDQGVDFIEARVINGRLSQLQDITQIDCFLPCSNSSGGAASACVRYGSTGPLFAVQVNIFDECDGIVVGVCFSHKILDGVSTVTFLNEWAADARGAVELTHHPRLDVASLFPHPAGCIKNNEPPMPHLRTMRKRDELKRLVFSPSSIARLLQIRSAAAAEADTDGVVFRPSRIEALTGLLLQCTAKARASLSTTTNKDDHVIVPTHILDMRRRLNPRLPLHAFGNILTCAVIPATEGFSFERQMRSAVADVDCIRQLPEMLAEVVTGGKPISMYYFTSWCRFPIYEVDFGWGKPSWVAPGMDPGMDLFVFFDGREDGEVEAWVQLEEDMMGELHKDGELAAFASPSSSIAGLFS